MSQDLSEEILSQTFIYGDARRVQDLERLRKERLGLNREGNGLWKCATKNVNMMEENSTCDLARAPASEIHQFLLAKHNCF